MVEEHRSADLSPTRCRGLLSSLGALPSSLGREALTRILEERDPARASIEVGGDQLRYRGKSLREWLTAFGEVPVPRWTFRGGGPGARNCTPLDALCGMQGRCMTPDVEGKEPNVVDDAIEYFRFHRERMRCSDFIARGLPIGSGPVESAAKDIVQARLKRSGMRWSRDGGRHVFDLRTFLESGRWERIAAMAATEPRLPELAMAACCLGPSAYANPRAARGFARLRAHVEHPHEGRVTFPNPNSHPPNCRSAVPACQRARSPR